MGFWEVYVVFSELHTGGKGDVYWFVLLESFCCSLLITFTLFQSKAPLRNRIYKKLTGYAGFI